MHIPSGLYLPCLKFLPLSNAKLQAIHMVVCNIVTNSHIKDISWFVVLNYLTPHFILERYYNQSLLSWVNPRNIFYTRKILFYIIIRVMLQSKRKKLTYANNEDQDQRTHDWGALWSWSTLFVVWEFSWDLITQLLPSKTEESLLCKGLER